jgi:tetratricopeptide (TPR) repeat protein
MLKKLIDPASDALIETIWSLLIEKGLKSLKGNYKQHLQKAINKTVEEYEKQFPISERDYRLHFYASAKASDFLARFVLFGEPLTIENFSAYLSEDTRITPPSQKQLEVFFNIFYQSIEEEKELVSLFIEENYKERIFKINESVKAIHQKIEDSTNLILQELREKVTDSVHLDWLEQIRQDINAFQFITALRHLEQLEVGLRKVNALETNLANILLLKGISLFEQGEFEKGADLWLEAWQIAPKNLEAMERALRVFVDRRKFDTASLLVDEILETSPYNPFAWAAKTFMGEGKIEEKLKGVPSAILDFNKSRQAFQVRLAGFCVQHQQYEDIGEIFREELEAEITLPPVITFENKGYWLMLANLYIGAILKEHALLPEGVHHSVKTHPRLPLAVAFSEKVLQAFEGTEKWQFLGYYRFELHFAKYCQNATLTEAQKVHEIFQNSLPENIKKEVAIPMGFILLQNHLFDELFRLADSLAYSPDKRILIPKAFALRMNGEMEPAVNALKTYFESVEEIRGGDFQFFIAILYDFTDSQEVRMAHWEQFQSKLTHPKERHLAELLAFWESFTSETQKDKALGFYQKLKGEEDNYFKVVIGELLARSGHHMEALDVFKDTANFDEESIEHIRYIETLAITHHDDYEFLQRLESWRRKVFKINERFLHWEIMLLQQIPDPEQIAEVAEIGMQHFPGSQEFFLYKAHALERLGKSDELLLFLEWYLPKMNLPEDYVLRLVSLMLRQGMAKQALELLYPYAENPKKTELRYNYFAAFIQFFKESESKILAEVTNDCVIEVESNGQLELIPISPENASKSEHSNFIGKKLGEEVVVIQLASGRSICYRVVAILDKYAGLYKEILNENEKKTFGTFLSRIEFSKSPSLEEMNNRFVELFGEKGDEEKRMKEKSQQDFNERQIGFTQYTQALGGNPIRAYYTLISFGSGIRVWPKTVFSAIDEDVSFALDFTSFFLFYELTKRCSMRFPKKFLVSPFLREIIEMERVRVAMEGESNLSIEITSEGVRPILHPENYKEIRLQFIDELLLWLDDNCEIKRSRHKLTMLGHLTRDEQENKLINFGENPMRTFAADTLFLAGSLNEKIVLVSDDLLFLRQFQGHKNCLSSELFLSHILPANQLEEQVFPTMLQFKYAGLTLPYSFVENELIKFLAGQENQYEQCLLNLGSKPELAIRLVKRIYCTNGLFYQKRRAMSQQVFTQYLFVLPSNVNTFYNKMQILLRIEFKFLPEAMVADVLNDWAIVCGRGFLRY